MPPFFARILMAMMLAYEQLPEELEFCHDCGAPSLTTAVAMTYDLYTDAEHFLTVLRLTALARTAR